MLTMDRKALLCFKNFRVDRELMKHAKKENEEFYHYLEGGSTGELGDPFLWNSNMVWDGVTFAAKRRYTNTAQKLFIEAYVSFRQLFEAPKDKIEDYFANIKKSASKLATSVKDVEDCELTRSSK